jgi:hypothetical protein
MKKQLILIILGIFFISISNQLKAQKPVYETGKHIPPPESKKKKNRYSRLYGCNSRFGCSNDVLYVADKMKDGSVITVYNPGSLKKESTFTLKDPQIDGHDASWFKRYFRGEEITSIYAYYDRKEDKNTIYGKITNRENKSIVKEKVLVSFNASKKKYIGTVGIATSEDKSKYLIFREPTDKKNAQETIEMWLYDDQLEKVFKKKLKFPYKNKQFIVQDYLVTNSGKVVIIAFYEGIKDEGSSFKVFGVSEDNEELDEIKIIPKGKQLSSAFGWVLDSGKSIVFTGFFRDDKKNKGATGIYYVKINANAWEEEVTKFSKISEQDLSKIFVGANASEKAKKKAKKIINKGYGVNNILLKELFYDAEGNIKIVTQVEYMVQTCTTDPKTGRQTCYYTYYNQQIIEFDLDPNGKIVKSKVIPKQQRIVERPMSIGIGFITFSFTTGVISPTNYLGHIVLQSPTGRLYFIFNDNDKNFDKKKIEKKGGNKFYYPFDNSKKSRLAYAYNSDKKDNAVKTAMVASYKTNIKILPDADVIKMADGSVIVWGKIDKTNELVLMRFYLKEKEKEKEKE